MRERENKKWKVIGALFVESILMNVIVMKKRKKTEQKRYLILNQKEHYEKCPWRGSSMSYELSFNINV